MLHRGNREEGAIKVLHVSEEWTERDRGAHEVQCDAHWPLIPPRQRFSFVPIIQKLEIGYGSRSSSIESARRGRRRVDVHPLLVRAFPRRLRSMPIRRRLVLHRPRLRNLRVPECSTTREEERVVHVPRVRQDQCVEVKAPGFCFRKDNEVFGKERGMREGLVENGREVV
jgi:hypothetical protein